MASKVAEADAGIHSLAIAVAVSMGSNLIFIILHGSPACN